MTSETERLAYYRLTREALLRGGAIVELGAWLGASTAYIAAAVRDSGVSAKAAVFDRFISKPAHIVKQRNWYGDDRKVDPIEGPTVETFFANMGPLSEFVEVWRGEIKEMTWSGGDIALVVSDAPKRVPEISKVMGEFAGHLRPGAIMAWQDFAHFASYDIPACLTRLSDHLEFVEAVHPGTTAVFRVTKEWTQRDVSRSSLAIQSWSESEIERTWAMWGDRLPQAMRPRFSCGAVMFLSDIGSKKKAVAALRRILANHPGEVLPKWHYLRANRPDLVARYAELFAELPA